MERVVTKKITVRSVGLDTAECERIADELGRKKPVVICRFVGSIEKAESQTGTLGSYIRYSGRFAAHNMITDTEYRGRQMILPAVAESALQDLIDAMKKTDNEASVEFALDLTVEHYQNANVTGTKFRYGVKPLREPGEDSLSKLLASFGQPPLLSFNPKSEADAKGKAKSRK